MNIKPIRNDDDLANALARMQQLWGRRSARPRAMSWKFWPC